jgi:hypothetical protein
VTRQEFVLVARLVSTSVAGSRQNYLNAFTARARIPQRKTKIDFVRRGII